MLQLQKLHAEYCACLDDGRYEDWPQFFTEECLYRIVPRENFERGLPLAALFFESRRMLEDRVFGIRNTLFHAPYYQRHIVSGVRVTDLTEGVIRCEASYIVMRTRQNEFPEILSIGRYLDVVARTDDGLKIRERQCVFDNELIPNSIIYPL